MLAWLIHSSKGVLVIYKWTDLNVLDHLCHGHIHEILGLINLPLASSLGPWLLECTICFSVSILFLIKLVIFTNWYGKVLLSLILFWRRCAKADPGHVFGLLSLSIFHVLADSLIYLRITTIFLHCVILYINILCYILHGIILNVVIWISIIILTIDKVHLTILRLNWHPYLALDTTGVAGIWRNSCLDVVRSILTNILINNGVTNAAGWVWVTELV